MRPYETHILELRVDADRLKNMTYAKAHDPLQHKDTNDTLLDKKNTFLKVQQEFDRYDIELDNLKELVVQIQLAASGKVCSRATWDRHRPKRNQDNDLGDILVNGMEKGK